MTYNRFPIPDLSKVRRVRIDDTDDVPHQMAQAANDDREREGDTEMGDDSAARSEAWRKAHTATTVTGERPETHRGRNPHERAYDDLPSDPDHETAQVGHPHNDAPEAA